MTRSAQVSPRLRLRYLALAISMALPAVSAMAQEADATTKKAEATQPATLEVVKVTAERRVEDIQDVPISITTVSGEKLDVIRSGGEDVRFLSGRLPSLKIESSFGRAFPRFYIRGLGNTDFDLNASQPVSLVYDDVVQENAILKGFPVFDLDQIEVLRGPQGTLFGRNSTAGVVKFDSARPEQEFGGYGRISYGTYGTTNIEGAVTGALSETVVGAVLRHLPAPRRLGRQHLHRRGRRARRLRRIRRPPAVAVRAERRFRSAVQRAQAPSRRHGAPVPRQHHQPGTNDLVDGFDARQDLDRRRQLPEPRPVGRQRAPELEFRQRDACTRSPATKPSTRSAAATSMAALARSSCRPSGPGFIPFAAESADGLPDRTPVHPGIPPAVQRVGPLRLAGRRVLLQRRLHHRQLQLRHAVAGGAQNGYATQQQENIAWAVYRVRRLSTLTETLKLRGGLRYTDDEKDFVADRIQAPPFSPTFIGQLSTEHRATPTSAGTSARSGLPTTTSTSTRRVANGFRAPSIQGRLLFGDTISTADSETVLSHEVGVKADFWDNRARLNFNVFHYTVNDQQLTAVGGAANFNQLINAKQTVGKGFELDFEAYLTDNLLVTFGASLNDTEIQDSEPVDPALRRRLHRARPGLSGQARHGVRSTAIACRRRPSGSTT